MYSSSDSLCRLLGDKQQEEEDEDLNNNKNSWTACIANIAAYQVLSEEDNQHGTLYII